MVAVHYGFYLNEISFYRDCASTPGLRTPAVHYSDIDDTESTFVLLLEDLASSRLADQIVGCPPEDAAHVIDAAAALHSYWWNSPKLDDLIWLRPREQRRVQVRARAVRRGVARIRRALRRTRLPAGALAVGDAYGRRSRTSSTGPIENASATIAHTDFRLDNFFFDHPDGSPVTVIDWQLSVRNMGAIDVELLPGREPVHRGSPSARTRPARALPRRPRRGWRDGLLVRRSLRRLSHEPCHAARRSPSSDRAWTPGTSVGCSSSMRGGARPHRASTTTTQVSSCPSEPRRLPAYGAPMSDAMIFGAFIPQGWKMELSSIDGAEAKWAKAVEIAVLAEELGYDSIWVYDHFHNVPRPGARGRVRVLDDARRDQPAHVAIRLGQMVGCNSYRNPSAAGEDHLDDRRDQRRPPRLGHRRRLVRERVQGLRLRVPRAEGPHRHAPRVASRS